MTIKDMKEFKNREEGLLNQTEFEKSTPVLKREVPFLVKAQCASRRYPLKKRSVCSICVNICQVLELDSHQKKLQTARSIRAVGLEGERLDSENRHFTIAFTISSNGKHHIALTSRVFKQYIFDWLGIVCDCYVLQSKRLTEKFQRFDANNIQEIIYESNKDKDSYSNLNYKIQIACGLVNIHGVANESSFDFEFSAELFTCQTAQSRNQADMTTKPVVLLKFPKPHQAFLKPLNDSNKSKNSHLIDEKRSHYCF